MDEDPPTAPTTDPDPDVDPPPIGHPSVGVEQAPVDREADPSPPPPSPPPAPAWLAGGQPARPAVVTDPSAALPSPRQLIAIGLELCYASTSILRTLSLAIGTQLLGCVGPVLLLVLIVLARAPELVQAIALGEAAPSGVELPPAVTSALAVGLVVAGLGIIALTIESQILAISVLGGRAVKRPVEPHEALRRSRQSFWRVFAGTLVATIPGLIASAVIGGIVAAATPSGEVTFAVQTVITTLFLIPFVYVPVGIVLGGVGAIESIRRSIAMSRIRWRLAIVAAVAQTLAQTLLVFGLSAGLDILIRVADALGLGLTGGAIQTFVTIVLVAMGVVAYGSLIFTVAAISAAPQVVAFIGLTKYAGGLDQARDSAPTARPVRWLSAPMVAGMALALTSSLLGAAAAAQIVVD